MLNERGGNPGGLNINNIQTVCAWTLFCPSPPFPPLSLSLCCVCMCIRLFLKESKKSTTTLILLDCLLADAGSTVKSEGFEAVRSHLSISGYRLLTSVSSFPMPSGNPAYLSCVWADSVCAYDLLSVILYCISWDFLGICGVLYLYFT